MMYLANKPTSFGPHPPLQTQLNNHRTIECIVCRRLHIPHLHGERMSNKSTLSGFQHRPQPQRRTTAVSSPASFFNQPHHDPVPSKSMSLTTAVIPPLISSSLSRTSTSSTCLSIIPTCSRTSAALWRFPPPLHRIHNNQKAQMQQQINGLGCSVK